MLNKIKQAVLEHRLWSENEPLLVAVSGGPDSVALLDALAQLRPGFGPLTVCHLNHKLRGAASDEDAGFVRQLAARCELPVEVRCRDVRQLADAKKISVEMAARAARLEFFQETAHATGVWKIALAHTADDQAETVLLRLIRGAGREGLSAMEPTALYRGTITLIRPMLRVWRAEVLSHLHKRGLEFREDETNIDESFLRNRVRRKLLPLLESEFNSGIKPVLRRTAEILGEEEAFLDALAAEQLRQCARGMHLRVKDLMLRDAALQRRMVRRWLAQWMPVSELTYERVEAVLRMASEPQGSASVDVGKGLSVAREYGVVKFLGVADKQRGAPTALGEQTLPVPGSATVAEWGMEFVADRVTREHWDAAMTAGLSSQSLSAFLDADTLPQRGFTLRAWREGDRFQPLGMIEEKKLQDFFVDAKVPKRERGRVPLVLSGDRIVWVVGHRIADWAKVTEKTTRVVKLAATRIPD